MRKIRVIAIVMTMLSCVSIFSIGFSSWFSFEPQINIQEGSYESYGVLAIDNIEMSVFNFSAISFRDENHDDCDQGLISVKYQIPKESLGVFEDEFTISLTLAYSEIFDADNYKLFYDAFVTNESTNDMKVFITGGDEEGIEYEITDNDDIYFEHTFKNVDKSKDLEFTVDYVFTVPSENSNFRNTFGKYLIGGEIDIEGFDTTKFSVVAKFIIEDLA